MTFDFLAGTWVYRSFRNLPEVLPRIDPNQPTKPELEKWNSYLFGQGEMELQPGHSGSFSGTFIMGPGLEMDLSGCMTRENERVTLVWNAVGRMGRASQGWIYEYRGELVPNWPNGRRQTDAIVGSVVRTVAHDDLAALATTDRVAPAGSVVSFLMVRKRFKAASEVIPLPGPVLQKFGSKHHRLHHLLWHFARNRWDGLKLDQQEKIAKLGWQPPRPNQVPVRGTVAERERDNGAGEDFLYMHRRMLVELRKLLAEHHLPEIKGWTDIPPPSRSSDNADGFAVPPAWSRPQEETFALIKSNEYALTRLEHLARRFKDPAYLKTLTLDQLGAKIEWLIHNQLHTRWSSLPLDPANLQPLPEGRDRFDVSDKWVQPFTGPDGRATYHDDLFDEFASHMHPVFWRLHGWIDDRVEDWAKAHEGEVTRKDVGGVPWFETGRWVKVKEPWVSGADHHVMEQVLHIISGRPPAPHTHEAAAATSVTPVQRMLQF
jgi:hypothetical protein